jgi:succinate dehydrogenase/fumarate reductase flavoprotein subunit
MKENKQAERNLSRRDFVKTTAVGLGATGLAGIGAVPTEAAQGGALVPKHWDHEADVVVIGAGATGLPAAIEAVENGASVIILEVNTDVGGAAIISGGNVALGGGTIRQLKYGVKDSPDLLFSDLTDWSVVESNGFPDYRYNDKEIIRAFADNNAPTCEWLMAHGVVFIERAPDDIDSDSTGNSAPRVNHAVPMQWPQLQTGAPVPLDQQTTTASGVGFIRPLEASARKLGVQILLEHRMTTIMRENQTSGRVLGISATNNGKTVNIRAKKGVIIATGGHNGNVNFRRIFDPRLTEEYQLVGAPWVVADASGELAGMAIGASLWGTYNQTAEFGQNFSKAGKIGTQYSATIPTWNPGSPVFPRARSIGLFVRDYQDVILVNQAGFRFYDETKGRYPFGNSYGGVKPYTPGSYLNVANVNYVPENFINAALAGTGEATNGGGPIWAIFDADAVKREGWNTTPPDVDTAAGYFFSANTIAELARNIVNKYQRKPVPPSVLQDTVTKYNSYVDAGKDPDFAKPAPKYKIQTAPFYAGWATPSVHDSRSGLRINAKCEVVDLNGNVIPGLYCGGESAGGFSEHGLARCSVQGRIAGREAAKSAPNSSMKS